jgi:acyl-CoA thioester hydrolase
MEQARIEWAHALDPERGAHEGGTGPVIVNASCTFAAPLFYPGDLEVRMYLGDPGRTSVGSFYEIWHDGHKFADGAAKIVWIDLASGRPVPLPDRITTPLRALGGVRPTDRIRRRRRSRHPMTTNVPLWQPTQERVARANIKAFTARIARETGRTFPDYKTLWRWSNDEHEAFWRAIWDYAGILANAGGAPSLTAQDPGARWFPDARLNFARICSLRAAATMPRCAGVSWRGSRSPPRDVPRAHGNDISDGRRAPGIGGHRRRPRRRLHPEPARGDHRDARRYFVRRGLVVVLAGFRRARRSRPLRADRASRARLR